MQHGCVVKDRYPKREGTRTRSCSSLVLVFWTHAHLFRMSCQGSLVHVRVRPTLFGDLSTPMRDFPGTQLILPRPQKAHDRLRKRPDKVSNPAPGRYFFWVQRGFATVNGHFLSAPDSGLQKTCRSANGVILCRGGSVSTCSQLTIFQGAFLRVTCRDARTT